MIRSIKYFDAISENRAVSDKQGSYNWIYERVGICPHCLSKVEQVFYTSYSRYDEDPIHPDPTLDEHYCLRVWSCTCGWWDILKEGNSGRDSIEPIYYFDPIWCHGILKSFDVKDTNLPIQALRSELKKRQDILYNMHHKKMEDLVASVFSDFYGKCKAYVCGKSHDEGIDIILVEGDQPIAIQVKRRQKPGKVEPVNLIREFLSAIQLKDISIGLYVTNSDKFSEPAKRTAELAIEKGLAQKIELIDKYRFIDILKETEPLNEEPWKKYLNELMK